ncbi:MAG: AAA family ATPase [Granulosicoccus sp.]
MKRLIIICGPTGAGKTTYAISLSKDISAIRFSIDSWMQTLFADDMKSLNYSWMIERVNRCYEQIWDTCDKIFSIDGSVVLDLGFTEKKQREIFADRAVALGITPEVHYLDAPLTVRKKRVNKRNAEKNPDVYAFDVTDEMFDFMEPRFEPPDDVELENGLRVGVQDS